MIIPRVAIFAFLEMGLSSRRPAITMPYIPNPGTTTRWDKFPAHVTLEQVLSNSSRGNYRETSYPVAVYRWARGKIPPSHSVTVSVLFFLGRICWGWLRYPSIDFKGSTNAGNQNHMLAQPHRSSGPP